MRISEKYNLKRNQSTLDFVDVDIRDDTKLFIDPSAIRLLETEWGYYCVSTIQDYFQTVLQSIRIGNNDRAKYLLRILKEPNETHLGLSKSVSRGRALGKLSSVNVWEALTKSEAVLTGLIEDLEDTILMVEGISSDIISDMTTNIIRKPLIDYTQYISNLYGIQLVQNVDSGPLWDPVQKKWYNEYTDLPKTEYGKIILIPKSIVRKRMDYNENEYYRDYILEYLKEQELSANTELVRLIRDGTKTVSKKDLKEKYGSGKKVIIEITRVNPDILKSYKKYKSQVIQPVLDHYEFSNSEQFELPDWDLLLNNVLSINPGKEQASEYENEIEKLLSALFYPSLSEPHPQHEIHNGRKRIDITYTNVSTYGFFAWLKSNYNAPYVFVECKNYINDPNNPELDQLSGRFSVNRGRCGILTCRNINNKELLLNKCRDTANDGRGFILALDDNDLIELVKQRKENILKYDFIILKDKFDKLVM